MNQIALALFIFSLIALTQALRCPQNCNNKGRCITTLIDERQTAICKCTPEWTGLACNKPVACFPTCKNGATCSADTKGNPICTCVLGFIGIDCGTIENLCVELTENNQVPCQRSSNGRANRCVPVLAGFLCLPVDSEAGCVSAGQKISCKTS